MAPNRRRNRNYILTTASLLVIVVASIIAAGCMGGTSTPGASAALAGTSWTLASLAGENGTMIPVLAGANVTATFSLDRNVGGNAGCNHYGAGYTVNGASLTIEPAIRTEMYCGEPPGIMDQEDRYLMLLTDVASYRIENDRLILADSDGTDLLVFEKAVPMPDLPLVGTDWVLEYYSAGDNAVSSVIAGTTVTVTFGPDGNVGGNAGCNHYGGGYSLDGGNLSVSSLFSTLMYCETPGVMDQEATFMTHLANATSYQVDGDRLTLTDADGTDLLFFVQAPEVPPAPLTGTKWVLDSYSNGGDAISSVLAGATVTVTFGPDGSVGGNAGCNLYGGEYTLDGTNLSVSALFSTLMYCETPGVMEQESAYLALLANATSYRVDGDRLTLTDAAGMHFLFFTRAEEVPPAPLAGTEWTLESYSLSSEAISSVIAGTTVTAVFSADGNVGGNAGCNSYSAGYQVNGANLTVEAPISTKMYCGEPEGVMEQENRYLILLESVAGYRIDGNRLVLTDEAGATLLTFSAGQP